MTLNLVHETRTKEQVFRVVAALKYGAVEVSKTNTGLVSIRRITSRDRRNGEWRES